MEKKDILFKAMLPVLPVLPVIAYPKTALWTAGIAVAAYWLMGLFFLAVRSTAVKRIRLDGAVWTALLLAIIVDQTTAASPLWTASTFLLFVFRRRKNPGKLHQKYYFVFEAVQTVFFKGAGLIFLIFYLLLLETILTERFHITGFHHPWGVYFLLFLAAAVWKNQPGRDGEK